MRKNFHQVLIAILSVGALPASASTGSEPDLANQGPPARTSAIVSLPRSSGSADKGMPIIDGHGPFELSAAAFAARQPAKLTAPPPLNRSNRPNTVPSAQPAVPALAGVTPGAVTSWEAYGTNWATGASYGGLSLGGFGSDAQIAVSSTHVIVTARDSIAFYTKSGLLVSGVQEGNAFFTSISGIPNLGSVFDMRVIYDSYRGRFFITGLGPFPSATALFVAVSKTGDPTQGFWGYWFSDPFTGAPNWASGDTSDYDTIGISPTAFVASANWAGSSGHKGVVVYLFDANAMVSGTYPSGWVYYNWTNPDGSLPWTLEPAVHHTYPAQNAVYLPTKWGNNAVVFEVTNPLTPTQSQFWTSIPLAGTSNTPQLDGPQKGVTTSSPPLVALGVQLGDVFLKASWRQNELYLTANNTIANGATHLSAGRVIRINTSNWTNEIDRTFGISSSGDPAGSAFSYGWAGTESNYLGDMAILTARTSSTSFPEIRISQWLHTDSDIESSVQLKAGEAPYHEGSVCEGNWVCYGELTGTSVDPDDVGIWVTQEYPVPVPRGQNSSYNNYSMWVGELFDSHGCGHGVCTQGPAISAACDSICVYPLCQHDSYCCSTYWDSICMSEIPTYCGGNTCTGLSP